MADDRIDSYVDRTGFSGDTKFVVDELNKIYDAFKKLESIKIGLSSSLGLSEVIPLAKDASSELDKMAKAQTNLAAATKSATEATRLSVDVTDDLSEVLARNQIEQKKLAAAKKELNDAFKAGKITQDEYKQSLASIIQTQTALSVSSQEASRGLKNIEKESQAASGSLNEMRAQLNIALQAFDSLSKTDKASGIGKDLEARIKSLTDAISKEEQATGRFQRNVGNYQGSAKIIVDALERTREKLKTVEQEFGKVSPEAQAVRGELNALDRITQNPRFLNIAANVGDTNKELKFFTQRLNELEDAGLKNSQVYSDVRLRLAQLQDQLSDTRTEIKALSSDTRSFDLFAGSVRFLASSWQAAAGAAQLFGSSNTDVQKSIQRLIAVQSIAQGVQQVAKELTDKGTAANKAYNFVLEQGQVLFGKGATAAARFGAALKLTGIGIAVTLIGKLVTSLGSLGDSSDDAADKVDQLTLAIDRQNQALDDNNRKIDTATKLALEKAKEQGKSQEVINGITLVGLGKVASAAEKTAYAQVTALKKTLDNYGLIVNSAKSAQDAVNFFRERGANKEAELTEKALQNFKKAEEARSQIQLFNAENAAKRAQDRRDKNKKAEEEAQRQRELALRAEFEMQKLELQRRIDFDKSIVDDETQSLDQRYQALGDYGIKKAQLINAQYDLEKSLGEKTKEELELIEAQRYDALLRLGQETAARLNELNVKTAESTKLVVEGMTKAVEEAIKKVQEAIAKIREQLEKVKSDTKQAVTTLISELEGLLTDILTSGFERQKNAIQDQIDLLDKQKQKDIDTVNQTVANRQEAANQIAIIEARAQVQREQLEKRQRQLNVEKAKYERAANIANIIQTTAQAVVGALAQVKTIGPAATALAILYGAIGAAQLARAIATPIPKYKHGKNADNYEGPAVVGDGGKRELLIREDGTAYLTPDRPTLTYVRKRDIILPDADKAYAAAIASSGSVLSHATASGEAPVFVKMTDTLGKKIDALNKTVRNKRELHMNASKDGLAAMWRFGATQIKYINDSTNW